MSDSALEQKAVEIITNLEKLAEPAMQLTLQAIRAAAIIDLATCIAFVVLAYFAWRYIVTTLFPKWRASESEFIESTGAIGFVAAGLITAIGSVAALITLLCASTWLAIFAPELQLARLLIEKVSG